MMMPERAAVFLTGLYGPGMPGPPASGRLMPVGNFVGGGIYVSRGACGTCKVHGRDESLPYAETTLTICLFQLF